MLGPRRWRGKRGKARGQRTEIRSQPELRRAKEVSGQPEKNWPQKNTPQPADADKFEIRNPKQTSNPTIETAGKRGPAVGGFPFVDFGFV